MPAGTANTVENLVFLQLIYAVGVESFSLKIKEEKQQTLENRIVQTKEVDWNKFYIIKSIFREHDMCSLEISCYWNETCHFSKILLK